MKDFDNAIKQENAVLVGIIDGKEKQELAQEYLDELALLTSTAGATPIKQFQQKIVKPNPKTLIGQGKLNQIKEYMDAEGVKLVIFDDELSPSQFKNIEQQLNCKVLDRTNLILDIFSKRAKTAQAKTQVELAQFQYILPRLTRMWTHHSRQQGGIGTKGPGEKEIETDRRIIHKKIKQLEEKLAKIDKQNATQRKNRDQKIRIALVGYTNSGKSTLLNKLSESEIKAENQLFATLDTTVRKLVLDRIPFLVSDTVGFIRKLPHGLVESFKSTLDELREADILIHVVDLSHSNFENQIEVVNQTLKEINAEGKPTILVFNKTDQLQTEGAVNGQKQAETQYILDLKESWMAKSNNHPVFISALKDENMEELKNQVSQLVNKAYEEQYPYDPLKVKE